MDMTNEQSPIDTLTGSLRYAYSDLTALLIGGIAAFLSMFLIGMPLYYGYFIKSLRTVINGGEKAPDFDDIGDMYVDGIKAFIVMLPYLAMIFIVILIVLAAYMIPMLLMINSINSNNSSAAGLWMLVMIVSLLVALVIEVVGLVAATLLMYASALIYADTSDIAKSINPLNALNLIKKNPAGYIVAYVSMMGINLIAGIVSMFIVTMPWAMQFAFTASSYLYGKYYRRTMPVVIEKPAESPSFT